MYRILIAIFALAGFGIEPALNGYFFANVVGNVLDGYDVGQFGSPLLT